MFRCRTSSVVGRDPSLVRTTLSVVRPDPICFQREQSANPVAHADELPRPTSSRGRTTRHWLNQKRLEHLRFHDRTVGWQFWNVPVLRYPKYRIHLNGMKRNRKHWSNIYPNLCFDFFLVDHDEFIGEFDSDRWLCRQTKFISCES